MSSDGAGSIPAVEGGGKGLLVEGRHREALEAFAGALLEHPEDGDAFDGASRALIELVRDGTIANALDEAGRDRLYRALILQDACEVKPPVFHHLLASRLTSRDTEVVGKVAAELAATLADLRARGTIHSHYVLMILVLRKFLGGWITPDEVSRLHVEWFRSFRLSDLSLPYSCMFNDREFGPNRDDLALVVADPGRLVGFLDGLSLVQVVFLEWLLGVDLIGRGSIRPVLASRLEGRSAVPEEEFAAARTLLIRHGWGLEESDPSFLESLGLDPSLGGLITSVAEARAAIRPASESRGGMGTRLFGHRTWQGMQAVRNLAAGKAPILRRWGRKPRAAICISGQLRGYQAAFATWQRTLLPLLDYDIFVHSWTRVGRSGAEPYRHVLPFEGETFQRLYRETCHKLGFEEFREHYPRLMKGLAETGNVTEAEVATFYGSEYVRLDDETLSPFAGWANSEKMHAKIEACSDLVAESGREYDLIVRIRPDLPIRLVAFDPRAMLRICRDRPVIFADHGSGLHYANPMIGDQLAIGAPGPMRIYSETWTTHPEFARHGLLQASRTFHGHSCLAQACWTHGIAVEKVPIRFGMLQDPVPLGLRKIKAFLEEDARERGDWTDRLLLDAVGADLRGSA